MGMVTPILVQNDELKDLCDNPERTAESIRQAACSPHHRKSCGLVSAGYSHNTHDRVLLVTGNNLLDTRQLSYKTDSVEFMQHCVTLLFNEIQQLKEAIKEAKDKE